MTTKITTIYTQIRSVVGTLLTGKTEIPNPYSLENNTELFLKNGWGVIIGSAQNSAMNIIKDDIESREFTVVITRQIFRLESDTAIMPAESLTLLEDIRTVKNDFLDFDQIGIEGSIEQIRFISASGIQFLQLGSFNFIYATLTFNFEYSETI